MKEKREQRRRSRGSGTDLLMKETSEDYTLLDHGVDILDKNEITSGLFRDFEFSQRFYDSILQFGTCYYRHFLNVLTKMSNSRGIWSKSFQFHIAEILWLWSYL